jgi:hypothetical protein
MTDRFTEKWIRKKYGFIWRIAKKLTGLSFLGRVDFSSDFATEDCIGQ